MSEIIERAESAISEACDYALPPHLLNKAARAAIEALREPTQAMKAAVENDACIQVGLDDCNQHDIPDQAWRLMIEAALGKVDA